MKMQVNFRDEADELLKEMRRHGRIESWALALGQLAVLSGRHDDENMRYITSFLYDGAIVGMENQDNELRQPHSSPLPITSAPGFDGRAQIEDDMGDDDLIPIR